MIKYVCNYDYVLKEDRFQKQSKYAAALKLFQNFSLLFYHAVMEYLYVAMGMTTSGICLWV